jgi:hypothetical protein
MLASKPFQAQCYNYLRKSQLKHNRELCLSYVVITTPVSSLLLALSYIYLLPPFLPFSSPTPFTRHSSNPFFVSLSYVIISFPPFSHIYFPSLLRLSLFSSSYSSCYCILRSSYITSHCLKPIIWMYHISLSNVISRTYIKQDYIYTL